MRMKLFSAALVMMLGIGLSACHTAPKNTQGVVGTGEETTTTGMGMQSGFGDGSGGVLCATAPAVSQVFFALNSSDVPPQANSCLRAQANYLVANPAAKMRVEGNCDNRGSREYNRGLGWRRATAVKNILLQSGAAAQQITTFSYGSEKASPGTGEQVWAHDRRVDVKYK